MNKEGVYALLISASILLLIVISVNAFASSRSYELTKTVTNGPWELTYVASKMSKDDWMIDHFLYARNEVRLRELRLSTNFSSLVTYAGGASEIVSIEPITYNNQLATSLEYNRLPDTKRMGQKEMLDVLSNMITIVQWEDSEGKFHEVEMRWK